MMLLTLSGVVRHCWNRSRKLLKSPWIFSQILATQMYDDYVVWGGLSCVCVVWM